MAIRKGTVLPKNAILIFSEEGVLTDARVSVVIPIVDDADPANVREITEIVRSNVSVWSELTGQQKTTLGSIGTRLIQLARAIEP